MHAAEWTSTPVQQASRVSKIVGIDLGTTHSAVAVTEAGMPGILADSEGRRLPLLLSISQRERLRLWVLRPKHQTVQPERTVSSPKRFIGRSEVTLVVCEPASPVEVSALI